MDQLVQLVSSKAGTGADQARTAVETVVGFPKDKLPAPVAAQFGGLMGGDESEEAPRPTDGLGRRRSGPPQSVRLCWQSRCLPPPLPLPHSGR